MLKTVKFGGTSMADAAMMRKCEAIVKADPARRYVVVSAPGKRFAGDDKVTDLLYRLYAEKYSGKDPGETMDRISSRFQEIVCDLGISFDLAGELAVIREKLKQNVPLEWLISRGEYLCAKIFACYLGWPFADAEQMIIFQENGTLAEETYDNVYAMLKDLEHAVIPGFYGRGADGEVKTFTRGGSDVTGSVISRGMRVDLYENWTDVSGVKSADPRVIKDAKTVRWISYRELRELSYMGASVMHEEAVFPLKNTGIPICIRNTMAPDEEGTMIVSSYPVEREKHPVTGIAGKKGFSNLQIEKALMNTQVGFGAKVLDIFAKHGISYEHTPTSIDIMSVICETLFMESCRNELIMEIDAALHPDRIFIEDGMALVAVVGEGIDANVGVAARVLQSIAEAGINVRMIDAGCSELNIIIGVNDTDYEKTIHALYDGLYEFL